MKSSSCMVETPAISILKKIKRERIFQATLVECLGIGFACRRLWLSSGT
jgi:hypothetical protein